MNKLQQHQLNMLIEIDRICKKHKINYTLDGGTLLGAVRHKGFIPWDDDLDILMSRDDYNKLKSIIDKELDKKYFFQDLYTDEYYGIPYTKIRENETLMIEKGSQNVKAHNGIYIDIFIYDNISDNKIIRKILTTKYIYLRMILLLKENYNIETNSLLKKILIKLLNGLKNLYSKKIILNKLKKIENKYKNINTKNIAVYGDVYFNKLIKPKYIFNEYTELEFEGKKFKSIKLWDEYLKLTFGDYMTPPPIEERENRHDITKLEFKK